MRKVIFILLGACVCAQDVQAAIRISEVYPAPESGTFEWVEITNTSSEGMSTKDYVVRDRSLHTLTLPHIILQKDQFVIATSSGVLNNSGDTIELVLNDVVIESLTYPSSISMNHSYNLCGDEWVITDLVSPGFDSDVCLVNEPNITIAPTVALGITPSTGPTLKASPTMASMIPSSQPAILGASQKAIQSFTQKHMPVFPTSKPTESQTLIQKPIETQLKNTSVKHPSYQNIYILIGYITLLLLALGGIPLYLILKKHREATYNKINDT